MSNVQLIGAPATLSPPRLSICIPTYNRVELIRVALDSILAHAGAASIEIIVGDNASTDGTIALLQDYQQRTPLLRYFRNEVNLGADRNLLIALELARGDYCWILGSDDAITPDAIPQLLAAMQEEPDLIMGQAINCDIDLTPTGLLQFLNLDNCTLDFGKREDVLQYLASASMHASLFGFLSSMVFKRAALEATPINTAFIGSAYPQVSRALDILLKGRGRFRNLAHPIAFNRRGNCAYNAEFGGLLRHYIDLRMFRWVIDDYFSTDLEIRNQFKAYVRRCYGGQIENTTPTGLVAVDRFRNFFRNDDTALPAPAWPLRPKVRSALERLAAAGFSNTLNQAAVLHLGFRGGAEEANRPYPQAIGVEIGYSGGYDGTRLPFESESQDTVWVSHCLHKMTAPAEGMLDWLRTLKPHGTLIISCTLADAPHGLTPTAFFGLLSTALAATPCRVLHCAQTATATATGFAQSAIDIVLEKLGTPAIDIPARMSAAMQKHQAGALAEAAALYQGVLGNAPNHFAANHMLGVVYFQNGQLQEAEQLLRKALFINANVPEVHYNLGCVLRNAGRSAEALALFQHSLQLNPNFEMAKARIAEM